MTLDLAAWMTQARTFAHVPQHWLHIDNGDTITGRGFASVLRHREQSAELTAPVFLEYSVDVVTKPVAQTVRHLSVTMDMGGVITQELLAFEGVRFGQELLTPILRLAFPLHEAVALSPYAHPPRRVATPDGEVARTLVTFHAMVDHAPPVVLYGPDGRPAR